MSHSSVHDFRNISSFSLKMTYFSLQYGVAYGIIYVQRYQSFDMSCESELPIFKREREEFLWKKTN